MLQQLVARRLVTPPAIWGKLPRHADFVRSGLRHGESEGWQAWLAQQGCVGREAPAARAPDAQPLPTAFVLPPATLPFARRRFVVGVIAPTVDKVGRQHVLLVYHLAHARWLRQHFGDAALAPHDWLFWLARTVARHTVDLGDGGGSDIQALDRAVRRLWPVHAPGVRQLWRRADVPAAGHAEREAAERRLLDQLNGGPPHKEAAAQLCGVRHLPWVDWPERLYSPRGGGSFWQQDAQGGYVNAATRLPALWGEA